MPAPPLKILLVEDNLDHVAITRQAVTSILPCEVEVVNDGEALILECYASGANSFLPKPATDKRFAEALRVLAGNQRPATESASSV
jgi:CheY-like chemotaxis protein